MSAGTPTHILREGRQFEVDAKKAVTDQLTIGSPPTTPTGGALTLIESQSPSGVSEAAFTSGIDSTYNRYIFEISDLVPATDGVNLDVQVSTDGGSTWKSSSDYAVSILAIDDAGTTRHFGSNNTNQARLTSGANLDVGSASSEGCMGTVKMSNPANGSLQQMFLADIVAIDAANDRNNIRASFFYQTAEAIDAVRFLFSSGNIESGDIDLYGVVT